MLLGIFSDSHGNLSATEAVIRLFRKLRVGVHIFCGDAVGYSFQAPEAVRVLRTVEPRAVLGNHDALLLNRSWTAHSPIIQKPLDMAAEELSPEDLEWLQGLPCRLELTIGGVRILIVHGDLVDNLNGRIYPLGVGSMLLPANTNVLIVGHTHVAFAIPSLNGLVLNPGSCGLPRDGDPRPSCATLNTETLEVEFYRLSYNCAPLIKRNLAMGCATETNDRLLAGQAFEIPISTFGDTDSFFRCLAHRLSNKGMDVTITPGGLWLEFRSPRCRSGLLMLFVLADPSRTLAIRTSPIARPWEKSFSKVQGVVDRKQCRGLSLRRKAIGLFLEASASRPFSLWSMDELTEICLQLRDTWVTIDGELW